MRPFLLCLPPHTIRQSSINFPYSSVCDLHNVSCSRSGGNRGLVPAFIASDVEIQRHVICEVTCTIVWAPQNICKN